MQPARRCQAVALVLTCSFEAMKTRTGSLARHATPWLPATLALLLVACGGAQVDDGNNAADAADTPSAVDVATGTTTLQLDGEALPAAAAQAEAQPAFHAAPVLLDAPSDEDAFDPEASARRDAHLQAVPAGLERLSTRGLTVQAMQSALRSHAYGAPGGTATPMASPTVVATYTPAQIRAAYGLPALPAAGTTLTAAQAASLGAGQTIYIVDAMHNPNAAAELAAFNQKFGQPGCTTRTIAPTASLPLPAASSKACEFSVVYNTATGGMTATAPAYDAGWATEIALDVQWAHAIAPLARIVLIESADATLNSLLGGIKLANAMGPGVVSMSFGAAEGNWTASVDSAFTAPRMTYLAATGDWGAGVSWPSVSANVVAVGGTTLSYSGSGTRSETGWSGTGGGTSAYVATPAYQTSAVPGLGSVARRTLADVAFNADPSTGQYTAVIPPGATTPNWLSVGGTSLSTPQWAGLIAIANAMRAQTAKAPLGAPHAMLYGSIATVPGTYAANFADITAGSNGSCATCTARAGYDILTGLGTPRAGTLLTTLSGANVPAAAPVVTPASISGKVGTALSFTVSATSANPLTYALSGAPAGMTIGTSGVVSWPSPIAGTYAVTAKATDGKTGLSGQAVYTVTIAAATAPVVSGGAVSGKPGVALTFAAAVSSSNPITYTLTGAPAGMTIASNGTVSWPSPVLGTYKVQVNAKDGKTGLVGQGTYTVTIATAGPTITAAPITGVAGKAVSGTIAISAPGATSVSVSITGVPLGMGFAINGLTLTASWPSPVAGSYTMKVTVVDSAGLTASASVPITISAK